MPQQPSEKEKLILTANFNKLELNMKQFNTFILIFMMAVTADVLAQSRYTDPVFDDVTVTSPVVYGVNASMINLLDSDTTNDDHPLKHPLVLDLYRPAGDTATARPLVLVLHTGNFFPHPANGGVNGLRTDSVCVEICTRLAKMGYVAASVDYRLGWNPFHPEELIRRWFLINAAYRGVQDTRTAIRFFKRSVASLGNPYGIDPNKIVVWGIGTGGYISLATATLDAYAKTLIPKFLLPGPVPMIIEQVNGDIYGTSVGRVPPGYPIFTPGDTLCHINHAGFDSDFQMAVNMGGALGDSSWIDPGQPAIVSYHVTTDPFAPYEEGTVLVPPPFNYPVVTVQGSLIVQKLSNEFGNNDAFADHGFIDGCTATANAGNKGYDGLYPFFSSDPTESAPWDFWAWNNVNATELADSIAAKQVIDSIMCYYIPRACLQLGLGCDLTGFSDTREPLNPAAVGLKASPNPATAKVRLTTNAEYPMQHIYVYDMSGRLVKAHTNVKASQFDMERNTLTSGMYIAKVFFKEGFATERILFH
jgi:hypothetical protein